MAPENVMLTKYLSRELTPLIQQALGTLPAGSRFGDRDLAGLKAWMAGTPGAIAGILAYNGTTALPLGGGLYAIPLDQLLS